MWFSVFPVKPTFVCKRYHTRCDPVPFVVWYDPDLSVLHHSHTGKSRPQIDTNSGNLSHDSENQEACLVWRSLRDKNRDIFINIGEIDTIWNTRITLDNEV